MNHGLTLTLVKYTYGLFDPRLRKVVATIRENDLKLKVNGQMWQDAWVLSHFSSKDFPGFFVDIGAAYPRKYSNTFLLQFDFKWSGVLVEPNPYLIDALREERSSNKVSIMQAAIGDLDGKSELLEFGPLSSLVESLNLDIYGDLREKHRLEGAETFSVEVYKPSTLLSLVGAPRSIDLLSIDVEGLDLRILKCFPFEQYDVNLICIEHNYDQVVYKEISFFLTKLGFVQECKRWSGIDAWFVRQDLHP